MSVFVPLDRPDPLPPRYCSWCDSFMTDRERERAEAGEKITHTMCPDCAGAAEEEIERWQASS